MAFGRRRARAKTTTTAVSVKKPKVHIVDGCTYATKAIARLHETLRDDALVESFELPTVADEKDNPNKKYGAKKCTINGFRFDSVMEGRYYVYLLHLAEEGLVKSFERQVTYILQEKYRDRFSGKVVAAIKYIADFVLEMPDGAQVVIDVKGKETPEFKLKQKMFGYRYPDIQFMCVQWSEREKEWQDLEDIKKRRRDVKKTKTKEAKGNQAA